MSAGMTIPVVTIDGPGGSGKGTVSQLLAARLAWHYLDSGALYRAVGLAAQGRGIDFDDEVALARLAREADICFEPQPGGQPARVRLDGRDVSDVLRTEKTGCLASRVAQIGAVREALLDKQREFRRRPGLVAEGRVMGRTVVPEAVLKVFLTASPEVRAERRYKQLKEKGLDVTLPGLLGEIRERDARDAARQASPLIAAVDAEILDTSGLSITQTVGTIFRRLQQRL